MPRLVLHVSCMSRLECVETVTFRVCAVWRLRHCSPHLPGQNTRTLAMGSTYCTPRSPVLKTSIRFSPKQANISTLQRPRPRTATSFSMSSASLALTSISAVSSPLTNFSARPLMYSAFRWESPAVRSAGRSFVRTCAGEGKAGWVSGQRAVNFLRIEAAAWPDT